MPLSHALGARILLHRQRGLGGPGGGNRSNRGLPDPARCPIIHPASSTVRSVRASRYPCSAAPAPRWRCADLFELSSFDVAVGEGVVGAGNVSGGVPRTKIQTHRAMREARGRVRWGHRECSGMRRRQGKSPALTSGNVNRSERLPPTGTDRLYEDENEDDAARQRLGVRPAQRDAFERNRNFEYTTKRQRAAAVHALADTRRPAPYRKRHRSTWFIPCRVPPPFAATKP